ncbi:MAG: hypothetical protein ACE10C_06710, partial [Candidatus Binatia bacterium]
MQRLRSYLWRHWQSYLLGGFCLLVTAGLVMVIPWWIRAAVSIIERGGSRENVVTYAVMIIGAAIGHGLVRTFSRFLIFNSGRAIEYELRNDI